MKVLLADDHKIVRAGIRRLLEEIAGLEVVGEAGDGEQAVELAHSTAPEFVITDISMPRMNGFELTAWLSQNMPQVWVIVLSMHTADDYVLKALRAGARGYLFKHAASDEVEQALRAVAAGEIYLSPGVSRRVLAELRSEAP